MSNIRYIEGLKLSTTCDTLEDVATEVTALKLALVYYSRDCLMQKKIIF